MKILIDGRFIGVGESLSRYTLDTTSRIFKIDPNNSYTLLIRPKGEKEVERYLKGEYPKNLTIKVLEIPHYSLAEQTALLSYLKKEKFDLVHFAHFNHPVRYRGKYVVTVPDLTMFGHLHRQKNFLKNLAFQVVMKSAMKDSAGIITISQYVKDELVDWYKISPEKIKVTYLATNEGFDIELRSHHKEIEAFKSKYGITGEYILYTGMWKKHKNLIRMVQAFEAFKKKYDNNVQLVLVGKIDKREPEVIAEINKVNSSRAIIQSERSESRDPAEIARVNKSLEAKYSTPNAIITTGFVKESELPLSYAGASAYIIPSLSEGFGLPPLEAMACGTPVISAKVSCMPEILGDAAYYFDPYNIEEMAEAMNRIITDRELRRELVRKGQTQAAKYDWNKTAQKTLEVYKKVLGK